MMILPFGDFFCRSQARGKSSSGYTSVGSLIGGKKLFSVGHPHAQLTAEGGCPD
jgi:hypothetical protein